MFAYTVTLYLLGNVAEQFAVPTRAAGMRESARILSAFGDHDTRSPRVVVSPTVTMTPERAREIWATRRPCGEFDVTPAEDRDVKAVWETMPGHTRWEDALRRIAQGHAYRPNV